MSKLYRTPAWREKRKDFIEGKTCQWNPSHEGPLTLDHTTYTNPDGSRMTDAQLMDFEKLYSEGRLLILCRRCAYARRHNKVLCEACGESYHGKKYEMCFSCHNSTMKADPDNFKLCEKCRVNYHDRKYPSCSTCNKKSRKRRSAKQGWQTRRSQGRKV